MNSSRWEAWCLLSIATLSAIGYALRIAFAGRIYSERVSRNQKGFLIGRFMLEMGDWGLLPLARLLVRLQVPPWAASWSAAFLGLLSGLHLASGRFASGAFIATLAGTFDAIDGQIARLSGRASHWGKVLDSSLDRYVDFFLIGGLVLHYRPIPPLLILALLALFGSFMVSYSTALSEIFRVSLQGRSIRRAERMVCLILGATLTTFTRLDTPEYSSEYPMVIALAWIAALSHVSAAQRLVAIGKAVKKLEQPTHATISTSATPAAELGRNREEQA